ncbi:unnamed protein product [Macrosiphum euphorbiae]|uniref:BESS domain-containing protein n=1 Tax=Macrosiphum euphorbiae TaxID=13131 RepID=A0AAV0WD74_9HEMI|nr:unnamed protein product [Macrosiphum euphorbiae]
MDNDDSQILQEEVQIDKDSGLKANDDDDNFKAPTCTQRKSKKNIFKKAKIDSTLDNAVETLKYVCKKQTNENEFTVFAKHIATQLEQLPLKEALMAQSDIQNILTRARISSMNEINGSTNPIVMTATNTTEGQLIPSPSDNSNSNISYSSNDSTKDEFDASYSDCFTTLEPVHQINQQSNLALFYNNFEIE